MKVSDYIADFLAQKGITHVFLVSGGAAVHMVDSVAQHPKLTPICCAHEQGAGTAADGYARISRSLGAAIVTSGPGPTNLVTSIANCWYDSIPALFLCGQVATFRIKKRNELRQKGFQETDVASLFSSLTKYVAIVRKASDIRFELEKAVWYAKTGRPGPVVLDIPDDIQRKDVEPELLKGFDPNTHGSPVNHRHPALISSVKKIFSLIQSSKRPVLILGVGVRIAGAENDALQFARHFQIPVLTTWAGKDLIPFTDPLTMGTLGASGPRAGNFAVQSADCIIALGTRLSQLVTGGKQNLFAPQAVKIMVDIDQEELEKFTKQEFLPDVTIQASLVDFFAAFKPLSEKKIPDGYASWRKKIHQWNDTFSICPREYYQQKTLVNPYVFIKALSAAAAEGEVIVGDTGANLAWTMQAFEVKKNQRIISAWNHTPMGYALPAAIGAAFATGKRVLCLTGDGGLMMCLSEMATAVRHKLPIKIFLFNNHGHAIQRQTIDTWLASRYTGVDVPSGLAFPDFPLVGKAFSMKTVTITNHSQLKRRIASVFRLKGPVLCNVEIDPSNNIVPYLRYGSSLDDMEPRLSPEELRKIMGAEAGTDL